MAKIASPHPASFEQLQEISSDCGYESSETLPVQAEDQRLLHNLTKPLSATYPLNNNNSNTVEQINYSSVPVEGPVEAVNGLVHSASLTNTFPLSSFSVVSTALCEAAPSCVESSASTLSESNSASSFTPQSIVSYLSSSSTNSSTSSFSQSGSTNAYRRVGLKKPTYAQIPGLTISETTVTKEQTLFPLTTPEVSATDSLGTFPNTSNVESYQLDVTVDSFQFNQKRVTKSLTFESFKATSSPVMAAMPIEEFEQTHKEVFTSKGSEGNLLEKNDSFNLGYREVYHHWFFKREIEGKIIWNPFSMLDSLKLEAAFTSHDISPDKVVATDGGRFDVNILRRERYSIYWQSRPTEVRRCSWFYKSSSEGHFVPYEENIATMLEAEFKACYESNEWNRKIELPNRDIIVFRGPDLLLLFSPSQVDAWGNSSNQSKPEIVKRGLDEFNIDEGEPEVIDHLLFLVHGIGSVCDLKFRSVEEVVDEFRGIALQLLQSHYRSSCEKGLANRIEVLPVSWHSQLHSEDTGIDKKLKSITLESIPRLRDFTNDTLLDILFYTSSVYCQTIISTVGNELNRLHALFKERNPSFKGSVSLGGHSLGSLILFDLLSHQHPRVEKSSLSPDEEAVPSIKPCPKPRQINRRISYMMSAAGTGQPQLIYPHLNFQPIALFALGSPIGMFITVRGLETLGEDFALPTCPAFFNIFHPYDPVAYRVESLINPQLAQLKPVLIPHHKGRKRMHLELKEIMGRVGADLKQKLLDSMKSTWKSLFQFASFNRQETVPSLEAEMEKVLENELTNDSGQNVYVEQAEEQTSANISLGMLNKGRRIDFVLQEAPFEFINEYIFALTSHVCYWESEDTMLMILKEIYDTMNIKSDNQIPQQTMTIERQSPSLKPLEKDAGAFMVTNNIEPLPSSTFIKNT